MLLFCSAYDGHLLDLFAYGLTLQGKNHIRFPLEETNVLFPTRTAFAVLQANELLFHLSAAVGTDLVAFTHGIFLYKTTCPGCLDLLEAVCTTALSIGQFNQPSILHTGY